jgi:Flp pilus assembly pilin Flp
VNRLNEWYLKLRESEKGQTMAEYGLILVAVAVAAYAGYTTLGGDISSFVSSLGGDL